MIKKFITGTKGNLFEHRFWIPLDYHQMILNLFYKCIIDSTLNLDDCQDCGQNLQVVYHVHHVVRGLHPNLRPQPHVVHHLHQNLRHNLHPHHYRPTTREYNQRLHMVQLK